MDKKKIINEIKKLINFKTDEPEQIQKFIDAKVGEDLIVRVDGEQFAPGLTLQIVTEDGVIPAGPELAGEHLLDNGLKIILDETGLITEVIEPAVEDLMADDDKKDDEEMGDDKKEDEELGKKKYEALEKRIEEMESIIKEMLEVNKATSEFSSVILEKMDEFVKDTPAELQFKSIKSEYVNVVNNKGLKKETNLEVIKNLRKKI